MEKGVSSLTGVSGVLGIPHLVMLYSGRCRAGADLDKKKGATHPMDGKRLVGVTSVARPVV
jgi:hypothetical protein